MSVRQAIHCCSTKHSLSNRMSRRFRWDAVDVFIYLQITPFCNKQMGYCLKTVASLQWSSFILLFLNQLFSAAATVSAAERIQRPVDALTGQLTELILD